MRILDPMKTENSANAAGGPMESPEGHTLRARTRIRAIALAVLLVSPSGGCSLMFVDGPPAQYQNRRAVDPVPCTTSNAWPVVDVLWTVLQTVRFIDAIGTDPDSLSDKQKDQLLLQAFGSVGFGLLFGVSSGIGFGRVQECREANADFLPRTSRPVSADRATPGRPPQPRPATAPTPTAPPLPAAAAPPSLPPPADAAPSIAPPSEPAPPVDGADRAGSPHTNSD
jgi:hypothetical protein